MGFPCPHSNGIARFNFVVYEWKRKWHYTRNFTGFSFLFVSASDKNYYDSRDISRVKTDDLFVLQYLNGKKGNVDKALKIMVSMHSTILK